MIFNRLAIGTANWGHEYNGAKVSEGDQKRILDYCQCCGITTIDTAIAYGWDGWRDVNNSFAIILKARLKDLPIAGLSDFGRRVTLMCHDVSEYMAMMGKAGWNRAGASLYDEPTRDVYAGSILQVPYSVADRRFEQYIAEMHESNEIHVRSIFLRGKLLKKFSPWECITFCLMNPHIDRVIIGVDNFEQLKENLRPFHRMVAAEIHDENILDPRRWTGKNKP